MGDNVLYVLLRQLDAKCGHIAALAYRTPSLCDDFEQVAVGQELDVVLFCEVLDMGHKGVGAAAPIRAMAATTVTRIQVGTIRGVATVKALYDIVRR